MQYNWSMPVLSLQSKSMESKSILPVFILITLLSSCKLFQKTAKYDFQDGFYEQEIGKLQYKVYVDITDNDLRIHPVFAKDKKTADVNVEAFQTYPPEIEGAGLLATSFEKHSFDIDFLTIPFKFRPEVGHIPAQLNTSINGALFLGYRKDIFDVRYNATPLGTATRSVDHLGFSMGVFSGFGNTWVNEFTAGASVDYEGIIWSNGFAGIIGVNNFTVGITIGVDALTDRYKSSWIYHYKPWAGLAFGLNLN